MCDDDLESIISLISTKINKIFCDREFVGCVREDLDIILKNNKYCVLFPKLKPIFLKVLRYQAFIFDLSVFCIGSGPNQVAVVFRKIAKELSDECPSVSSESISKRMDPEENTSKSVTKKSRIRPTQSYYVPPAQRSLPKKSKVKENTTKCTKKSSSSKTSKKTDKVSSSETSKKEPLTEEEIKSSDDVVIDSECVDSSQVSDSSVISNKSEFECFKNELISESINVELPLVENEIGKNSTCKEIRTCATLDNENPVVQNLDDTGKEDKATSMENAERKPLEEASSTENSLDNIIEDVFLPVEENEQIQSKEIVTQDPEIESSFSNLYISYDDDMKKKSADCDTDNEKEEMKRALEIINRKRRPLIKNMHNDDPLSINDSKVTPQRTYSENEKNNVSKENNRISSQEDQMNLANWEDMFDDNGELHAEFFGEIVKQIGCEVKVVKASHDYSDYQNTKYQDLEHVIELYDFPSTFKTQDIMQLYRGASQSPMYVKWCDDTHCLLVLSTPAQAQRALQIEQDVIKSRPLGAASSIAAAAACSSDLKPAMKRPQTSMQTARRLINSHLGTKSTLSKEEVEQERQALRDAREQRRLERQNEKDAWEGRPKNTKPN